MYNSSLNHLFTKRLKMLNSTFNHYSKYLFSPISSIVIILITLFSQTVTPGEIYAANIYDENPKNTIFVKDYKWKSGGMGRPGILKEITLENKGKNDYENIEIEIDLYSNNDIPLGSLRSTIRDVMPAGSEKTFHNLDFGLMSSPLENSIARVVGADLIETGTPSKPKDLIIVKDWQWAGASYGTEGILKKITLENRSKQNFKDIKLKVNFLGTGGPKEGVAGPTTRVVIHDLLPADSTRTFYNINIGFKHPDARDYSFEVLDAKRISKKEIRYRLAKQGKKGKKKGFKDGRDIAEDDFSGIEDSEALEKKPSLSERYKQKLEDGGSDVAVKPMDESEIIDEDYDDSIEYDKEVPLPEADIIVKDFTWAGGVPYTIGVIKEIILENISSINYTNIELKVEFFSASGNTPLGSNLVKINEVLPAKSEKTFKNVKAGYLNLIPEEVKISVTSAVNFN